MSRDPTLIFGSLDICTVNHQIWIKWESGLENVTSFLSRSIIIKRIDHVHFFEFDEIGYLSYNGRGLTIACADFNLVMMMSNISLLTYCQMQLLYT